MSVCMSGWLSWGARVVASGWLAVQTTGTEKGEGGDRYPGIPSTHPPIRLTMIPDSRSGPETEKLGANGI